jgi:cysteine-rich repeat protein
MMRILIVACLLLTRAAHACPTPITLSSGVPYADTGTTVGAADSASNWCDGSPAPDVTYAFHVPSTGSLRGRVNSHGSLVPVFLYRLDCETDYGCMNFYPDHVDFSFEVEGPADYFFIVDGAAGTSGAYDLEMLWNEPECGDGVVNSIEDCDVGELNGVAGSGCSPTCTFEPAGAGDTCASAIPVTAPRGLTTLPLATTLGYSDDYDSAWCTYTGIGSSGDLVYAVTPARSGTLVVALGYDDEGDDACERSLGDPYCWDRVLYARRTCGSPATEVACSDVGAPDVEVITFSVTKNVPIFVFIDGYWQATWSHGPVSLELGLF